MDQDRQHNGGVPTIGSTDAPPDWVRELANMVTRQSAQISALQATMAQYETRTTNLTPSEPSASLSTQPTPVAYTPTSGGPRQDESVVRRRELLPKPPEFHGDRAEFRPWLGQIRAKLEVDLSAEKETVQFWYTHNRLRGRALQQVTPWVTSAQQMDSLTTEGLFEQLRLAYDDHESAERAARKLNTLRQGTKPFSIFLAEFDRTLLDAGGLHWDEQVKKTFLMNGICIGLQEALIATPIPPSYASYCNLLQSVSNNLESLHTRRKWNMSPIKRVQPTERNENVMDWEQTPAIAVTSINVRRAKWVPKSAIDDRKGRGLCIRCGEKGHFVRECKVLPAVQPVVQTAVVQQRAKPGSSDIGRVRHSVSSDSENE